MCRGYKGVTVEHSNDTSIYLIVDNISSFNAGYSVIVASANYFVAV